MENNYESILTESAAELTSDGAGEDSTQSMPVEGQPETAPVETAGSETESAKSILEQLANEKPVVDQELFNQINALGAIHNGTPIKIDSPEQLKEMLQKGFDYTKKTMAHAEDVRLKTEEFAAKEAQYKEVEAQYAQKEQQLQNTVFENKIMENMLVKWQQSDPELFAYLSSAYNNEVRSFEMQKPLIAQYENQFKQLNDRFSQLEQGKQQEAMGSIKQNWEKGLSEIQSTSAAPLAKLGIKPDWDKVKEVWSADSTNKMTVEDALYSVYGKAMADANKSYQKLLTTKNKTQASILGRSGVGKSQVGAKETLSSPIGDYETMMRQYSSQI